MKRVVARKPPFPDSSIGTIACNSLSIVSLAVLDSTISPVFCANSVIRLMVWFACARSDKWMAPEIRARTSASAVSIRCSSTRCWAASCRDASRC